MKAFAITDPNGEIILSSIREDEGDYRSKPK